MNTEQALAFLRAHQPMPSDRTISPEIGATFASVLRHFETEHDERCLPLLIHSVSTETGLGMYEHITFVLMAHPREQVAQALRDGLTSGSIGVLYRCCLWAADVGNWDLVDLIQPLATHPDQDVQMAAQAFIELRDELS